MTFSITPRKRCGDANPAELPAKQSTKFEFIVNLEAVKQFGYTIPDEVLARANQVIR